MSSVDRLITTTAEHVAAELGTESSGHDWWHVYRVWKTASTIAEREGANALVVQLAALLHDISDYKLNGGDTELGPRLAGEWLRANRADNRVIEQVCEIVATISFRGAGSQSGMSSLEGLVVQDADRLDAIGAVGIARAFAFGGYKRHMIYDPREDPQVHQSFEAYKRRSSSSVTHFYEKLLLLKDEMKTDTGRRIAEGRHEFMVQFLKEFFREWNCEDLA